MTPYWTPTSGLPPGDIVVWTGRYAEFWAGGLDGWSCSRVDLYAQLDVAPELIVVDALSFPWEALRPSDWDIPLVVALPPDLDDKGLRQVLGDIMLQYLTPYDRLVGARDEIRKILSQQYGLPSQVWIEVDTGTLDDVLARLHRHVSRNLVELDTDIGTFVLPKDDLITQQLQEFGAHQRGDLNALISMLRPGDVVLDIGAHVGTFAVPIANAVGPNGSVIAFEGHPGVFRLLRHNVEKNGPAAPVESVQLLLGSGRSLPRVPVMSMGNSGGTWFQSSSIGSSGSVSPTSLDSWIETYSGSLRPTFLKLDVEGAEFDVLSGAERTIEENRPLLMIEVSEVLLERNGSTLRALDEWLSTHEYGLYLSTGTRNTAGSGFSFEPMASLFSRSSPVFDVFAIPKESDRCPEVME